MMPARATSRIQVDAQWPRTSLTNGGAARLAEATSASNRIPTSAARSPRVNRGALASIRYSSGSFDSATRCCSCSIRDSTSTEGSTLCARRSAAIVAAVIAGFLLQVGDQEPDVDVIGIEHGRRRGMHQGGGSVTETPLDARQLPLHEGAVGRGDERFLVGRARSAPVTGLFGRSEPARAALRPRGTGALRRVVGLRQATRRWPAQRGRPQPRRRRVPARSAPRRVPPVRARIRHWRPGRDQTTPGPRGHLRAPTQRIRDRRSRDRRPAASSPSRKSAFRVPQVPGLEQAPCRIVRSQHVDGRLQCRWDGRERIVGELRRPRCRRRHRRLRRARRQRKHRGREDARPPSTRAAARGVMPTPSAERARRPRDAARRLRRSSACHRRGG